MDDMLTLGGRQISNRLFIGTGKFARLAELRAAITAAGVEVATVAVRRIDRGGAAENILDYVPPACQLLPNTSGARTADEAIRIARLARAAGCGDWIKIEVTADSGRIDNSARAVLSSRESWLSQRAPAMRFSMTAWLIGTI